VFEPNKNGTKVQENFVLWQKAVSRAKNWIG
jgi:hypothetical protein